MAPLARLHFQDFVRKSVDPYDSDENLITIFWRLPAKGFYTDWGNYAYTLSLQEYFGHNFYAWLDEKQKPVDLNTNVSLLIVSKETSRSLTYYYEEASQIYIDTSSPPLSILMGLSYSVDTLHPSPFSNCGLILSVEESNTDLDNMS